MDRFHLFCKIILHGKALINQHNHHSSYYCKLNYLVNHCLRKKFYISQAMKSIFIFMIENLMIIHFTIRCQTFLSCSLIQNQISTSKIHQNFSKGFILIKLLNWKNFITFHQTDFKKIWNFSYFLQFSYEFSFNSSFTSYKQFSYYFFSNLYATSLLR